MNQERDCNTCSHHVQGVSLDDVPAICWDCSHPHRNLPHWDPMQEMVSAYVGQGEHGPVFRITVPEGVSPLTTQVAGDHYKGMAIQPIEFAMRNRLNACQAKVVKYVCRKKGDTAKRIEDLEKAKHVIDLLIGFLQAGQADSPEALS